ncbi:hypothetical protein TKK_0005197 [Trichogramma kaykai]
MKLLLTNKDDDNPRYWIRIRKDDGVLETDDSQTETRDYVFLMKSARLIRSSLIELCRKANSAYGIHLLLSIIFTHVMVVSCTFTILLYFISPNARNASVNELWRYVLWTIFYFVNIYLKSWFCSKLQNISMQSGRIICELYEEPMITEDTKIEMKYFIMELIENKLELHAAGVFHLNLFLIKKIFGMVFTFVILLVQIRV